MYVMRVMYVIRRDMMLCDVMCCHVTLWNGREWNVPQCNVMQCMYCDVYIYIAKYIHIYIYCRNIRVDN